MQSFTSRLVAALAYPRLASDFLELAQPLRSPSPDEIRARVLEGGPVRQEEREPARGVEQRAREPFVDVEPVPREVEVVARHGPHGTSGL